MNELYDDKDDVRMLTGRIRRNRMKKMAAIVVAALVTVILVRQSVVGQDELPVAGQPAAVQAPVAEMPAEAQVEEAESDAGQPSDVEVVAVPAEGAVPAEAEAADPTAEVLVGGRAETTATAGAITSTGGTSRVTIRIEDATLTDMIRIFMQVADANIVIASTNVSSSTKVAPVLLRDVEWMPALSALLRPYKLTVRETKRGSGIYEVQDYKEEAPQLVTETIVLKYAAAQRMRSSLTNLLWFSSKKKIDDKDERISMYPAGNALVVQAFQSRMDEIKKIIQMLDKPRMQVYVEVKIAEITRGDQRMFGFDWDVSESKGQDSVFKIKSTSLGTEYEVDAETAAKFNEANSKDQSASSPLAYLMNGMVSAAFGRDVGQLSPDVFNVTIRAWEQNGDIDFLSNPKLIVANEETATIDMTTKEPYIKTTRQSGSALAGGGTSPDIITAELSAIPGKEQDENVAFFQHGITVKVTPRIEDSGDTTIKVKPVLSKKVKDVAMTSDTNYLAATIPIIFAKTVDTEFTLADGYTAVIGGLTETDKQEYVDAIPFLSRIPVIGKILFTKKSTKNVQRETIIFVTVTRADVRPMDVKAGLPQNASLVQKQMKRMVPQEQEKEAAQPPPANPKRKSWLPWRR